MGHVVPQELDILCGRGGLSNKHAGNQLYLRIVQHNKDLYQEIQNPKHKHCLAQSIIDAVEGAGARFLKQDKATKAWDEISRDAALSKTLQALRERSKDNSKSQRPSSSSAKSAIAEKKKQQNKATAPIQSMPTMTEQQSNSDCLRTVTSSSAGNSTTILHRRSVTPECHVGIPYFGDEQPQQQQQKMSSGVVSNASEDDSSCSTSSSLDSSCTPYEASNFDELDLFDGAEWDEFDIDALLSAPLAV